MTLTVIFFKPSNPPSRLNVAKPSCLFLVLGIETFSTASEKKPEKLLKQCNLIKFKTFTT